MNTDTPRLHPTGYSRQLVTLDELHRRHTPNMHPEFARRLFAWIEHRTDIAFGIGEGRRLEQPDRPGFAPPGQSFHELQVWAGGRHAFAAVDLVVAVPGDRHRAPRWSEVPAQDSAEAALWGVHVNVGNAPTGEPWHMQPIELDGFGRWANAGRPELQENRPLPTDPTTPDYPFVITLAGQPGAFAVWPGHKQWLPTPAARDTFLELHNVDAVVVDDEAEFVAYGACDVTPPGYDQWGVRR